MEEYQHSEQSRPEQLRLLRIREIVSTEITYNKTLSLVQTVKYFILKKFKKDNNKKLFFGHFLGKFGKNRNYYYWEFKISEIPDTISTE